jgi:hypothetical protein
MGKVSRVGRPSRMWLGACVCLFTTLGGCASVGPRSLKADEVEYARALGEAKKREILALIVGLRYADLPGFLNVSQIIAAYTFDATGGLVANTHPDPGGPGAGATGALSYSNHPTFTFTPTTGEYFARAYIHPLAPALILPLADSGIPIDLLLRISVQSIGRLQNATMLGGPTGNGSPEFFELLRVLRRLQLAGELSIRYKNGDSDVVTISLGVTSGMATPNIVGDVSKARTLLNLPSAGTRDFEVVFGTAAKGPAQIPLITRSVLAILSNLGGEIAVPAADVERGATKPAIGLVGGEARPTMVVHATSRAPDTAYVAIPYRSSTFWIDESDFDSKYALTVVQDLMALAEVPDATHAPVVTVPAN